MTFFLGDFDGETWHGYSSTYNVGIAKLVQITPVTIVYDTYNYIYIMGFINQLITGGAHCT